MRRSFHIPLLVLALGLCGVAADASAQQAEIIDIDANASTTKFPHFGETMFGSGRAVLALRESYRNDLRAVKAVTDLQYVRFHAILHDENGVYNEDQHGKPAYNFVYVDQIYDGLLTNGVRPVKVSMQRVDETHSNVMPLYKAMGSPVSPTAAQVEQLNQATALAAPEQLTLKDGSLTLDLGSNALYLLRIAKEAQ